MPHSPERDKGDVRTFVLGVVSLGAFIVGGAVVVNRTTDAGYSPDRIGLCKPHFTSKRTVTQTEAIDIMNNYVLSGVGGYLDSAAQGDHVPFQDDEISGLSEIVCRLALTDNTLHLTTTGEQIANDPAFATK